MKVKTEMKKNTERLCPTSFNDDALFDLWQEMKCGQSVAPRKSIRPMLDGQQWLRTAQTMLSPGRGCSPAACSGWGGGCSRRPDDACILRAAAFHEQVRELMPDRPMTMSLRSTPDKTLSEHPGEAVAHAVNKQISAKSWRLGYREYVRRAPNASRSGQ